MDQSTESVTTLDLVGRRWTGGARWVRRLECKSAVGTLAYSAMIVDPPTKLQFVDDTSQVWNDPVQDVSLIESLSRLHSLSAGGPNVINSAADVVALVVAASKDS